MIEGGAGVGKSFLAAKIASLLGSQVCITATTGIVAKRLGGMTLDRFLLSYSKSQRALQFSVVIVDEISMCDSILFDRLCHFIADHRLRLICVGDVAQLPPVRAHDHGWFFQAEMWSVMRFNRVDLTIVRRTNNIDFAHLCARFRSMKGKPTNDDIAFIRSRFVTNPNLDDYEVFLASKNSVVDARNIEMLNRIEGFPHDYDPIIMHSRCTRIPGASSDAVVGRIMRQKRVTLKAGARVIATKNHIAKTFMTEQSFSVVNGAFGTVTRVDDDACVVLFDGENDPVLIQRMEEEKSGVHFRAMPLRLAWALRSIKHKG